MKHTILTTKRKHPIHISIGTRLTLAALFAASVLLAACSGNSTIYQQTHTFTNNTWMRFEPEVFEVPVDNADECYDIHMSARLDTTLYQLGDLPLIINVYSPDGQRRMFNGHIQVRDKDNHLTGHTTGRFVDVTAKVTRYFYFNSPGTHRIEVKNNISKYELRGIANFAMRVEKSPIVYPE